MRESHCSKRLRRAERLAPLVGLLALWVSACTGGSGSSGFDIHGENAVIEQVRATGRCLPAERLTVCPADVPAPAGGGGTVETDVAGERPLACTAPEPGAACHVTVRFTPSGFPPGATFAVAVREAGGPGPWRVTPVAPAGTTPAPPLDASVPVPPIAAAPGMAVEFAVLVFPEGGAPPPVADRLGATGAAAAFVTAPVAVAAPGPEVRRSG